MKVKCFSTMTVCVCVCVQVAGMDGVYMVNVYDGDNNQTRISYNKGARWRSLTAPPVDSEGQPILCQPVST